jgi:prefoldin alpha subunit
MKDQQELMFKLQMFEQQIQQLQQQIQAVEKAIIGMTSLKFELEGLIGKKDKEIMAPIGNGIFAKARLISENLIIDVGGKNFVTKNISQTKELINEQIKKLKNVQLDLKDNLEKVGEEFNKMIVEAQKGEGKE